MTTEDLIERAGAIQRRVQAELEESWRPYTSWAVKTGFPSVEECSAVEHLPAPTDPRTDVDAGTTMHSYRMQHSAVESGSFDPDHAETVKMAEDNLVMALCDLWLQKFRQAVLSYSANRAVIRPRALSATLRAIVLTNEGMRVDEDDASPRAVDIFGREVLPWKTEVSKHGIRLVCNPKYDRVAVQRVVAHSDVVHFLFPDREHWVGKIRYFANPDNQVGVVRHFFRAVCQVAARPVRPDLGYVVTVVPPGWRGWLYYWAWKLVRFVP